MLGFGRKIAQSQLEGRRSTVRQEFHITSPVRQAEDNTSREQDPAVAMAKVGDYLIDDLFSLRMSTNCF
jgi:hypothetical protein